MLKIFKLKKGFTLIELLVVISVIAVLAVAVLSSINPVEQINKAKDTASKSDAAELLNSVERYYATFQCYPWDAAANSGACPAQKPIVQVGPSAVGSMITSLTELASKSEIKSQFVTRLTPQTTVTNKNVLIVTEEAVTNLVHVCFLPSSKTFVAQRNGLNTGQPGATHVCVP